jgi:hypothetical protein
MAVRPTLRKRLEESPLRVDVIVFIASSIAPLAQKMDHANDLISPPPNPALSANRNLIAGIFVLCAADA